jgi:uncharacterized protein (DUF305 family)
VADNGIVSARRTEASPDGVSADGVSADDVSAEGVPASGGSADADPAHPAPAGGRRSRLVWAPLVVVLAAGLVAAGFGLRGLTNGTPGNGSVDAGFLRDMSEHHGQAVQMGMLEFSHGADPQSVAMGQDIALSQQREVGVMGSWLADWGLTQSTVGPPMTWMGGTGSASADMAQMPGMSGGGSLGTPVGTDGVRMPGMAGDSELAQLASARGRDSDVRFLTLMIHHHRGGVLMAQYASRHASEDDVRALAKAMVVVQSAEIGQMEFDLRRLGAPAA